MNKKGSQEVVLLALGALLTVVLICALTRKLPPSQPTTSTESRPALPVQHPPEWIEPEGIILHCSDSPAKVGGRVIDERAIAAMHHTDHPTWATTFEGKTYRIGYHYVILADGTIQKGRPDHCIGAHAHHFNNYLGICVVGNFIPHRHPHWKPLQPTPQEIHSVITLCEQLMAEYHIPIEKIKRHGDVDPTPCPGQRFPFDQIINQIRQDLQNHRTLA